MIRLWEDALVFLYHDYMYTPRWYTEYVYMKLYVFVYASMALYNQTNICSQCTFSSLYSGQPSV